MAPNICVIGANGYIGRHLVFTLRQLHASGVSLRLADMQEHSLDKHSEYQPLDVLDCNAVAEVIKDQNYIFFLSGLTGTSASFDNYDRFVRVNEIGLLNLLESCRSQLEKPKIIFPSTRLIYKGMKDTPLTEEAPKEFKTIYAMNKYSCEQYLQMYSNCFGIRFTVLRICVPYGNSFLSNQSFGTLSHFVSQAQTQGVVTVYGKGDQKRTLTHIDDLCRVLIDAGLTSKTDNEVFNVGGADVLSVYEIAQGIAEVFGVHVEHQPWPPLAQVMESGDTIFDSGKLDTLLDVKYTHSFNDWLNGLQ